MRKLLIALVATSTVGCAAVTENAITPTAFMFSDSSNGECRLTNDRGDWEAQILTTFPFRKSDGALKYQCETEDGRKVFGVIHGGMGGKDFASAVFIDIGNVDDMTYKHRKRPAILVIPVEQERSIPQTY